MKFSQLSDGSTALNRKYENTVVSVTYSDRVTQKEFLIKIPCPRHAPFFSAIEPVGFKDCAKTVIEKLDQYFDIDSDGRYSLSPNKSSAWLYWHGAIVGLSLKAEEYPYLVSVRSDATNINYCSVAVKNEDIILLEEINTPGNV